VVPQNLQDKAFCPLYANPAPFHLPNDLDPFVVHEGNPFQRARHEPLALPARSGYDKQKYLQTPQQKFYAVYYS